ncbi:MAG: flagellar biosynthesis anti-sigma factor FlgM [Steroidobacteraceae bacterium]
MSSKINGLNGTSPAVETGSGARRAAEAATGQASGSAAAAQAGGSDVQITDSASVLSGVAQQLSSLPAVNSARVAQLQSAVDSGTYTVQPHVVAGQLMQFEQTLAQIHGG